MRASDPKGQDLSQSPNIIIISLTRFHYFNLAIEMAKTKRISIYTAWPEFMVRKNWPAILGSYRAVPIVGFLKLLNNKIFGSARIDQFTSYFFIKLISRALKRRLQGAQNRALIIGSATNTLGLKKLFPNDLIITDYASFHPTFERKIMCKENQLFGFKKEGNERFGWREKKIIKEFDTSDAVFVVSNQAKRNLIENGVAPNKIYSHRYCVDLSEFRFNRKRTDFGKKIKIIFVGATIPRKGVHRLIEAALDYGTEKIELTFVGKKPRDLRLRKIIELAEDMGLVIRQIGSVQQKHLEQHYWAADVFCLPSLVDGWGLVTNQAAATGLPLLVSKYAGSADLVKEGRNGYVFDPTNVEDLRAAIERMHKLSGSQQNKMRLCSKKIAQKYGSWETHANDVSANIQHLLNSQFNQIHENIND